MKSTRRAQTLPEKIAELQQKAKTLKKNSIFSPKGLKSPIKNEQNKNLTAFNVLNSICSNYVYSNNKENYIRPFKSPENINTKISKDQTNKLSRILLANTIDNIENSSKSSASSKKNLKIKEKNESEFSDSKFSFQSPCSAKSPQERESAIKKLHETQKALENQNAKILALTKRNAFLEARHNKNIEVKSNLYRGDLVKSMKNYAEIKARCKTPQNSELNKGGFSGFYYVKTKGEEILKDSAKIIRGGIKNVKIGLNFKENMPLNRNTKNFKEFVNINLRK